MFKKIKLILKSVREYKLPAILTPIFMIGEAGVDCALPFVMTLLFAATRSAQSFQDILPYVLLLVGLSIVAITCGILGGHFAAKASNGLAKNLRRDLYVKLQNFSFENIDKFSTSSLITRMTTDISFIQMAFQMMIRIVVRAPLMFVFSLIMAFVSAPSVAWAYLVVIPILIIGLAIIASQAFKIFRVVFRRYDKINESIQENISGIRTVKSYVREDYERQKFSNASNDVAKSFIKAEKIVAWNNPLMMSVFNIANMLVFYIGARVILGLAANNGANEYASINPETGNIVYHYGMTPEKISSLLTYGAQILSSLMMISMIMVMLVMSMESIRRVAEVLEEESTIKNPESPIYEVESGDIEFKNVNFKYKEGAEKNTLENINISIKNGEFVGILGATGTGKTTLVSLISRLYDVKEGEVIVGGHNVKDYDIDSLRNSVSVVLQKNVLFSGTIEENLKWGDLNATHEEVVRAAKIAQADEFVSNFPDGYNTHIEQGGTNVSGGQKQRLCIARAILKKPKVLILDDSTSAVDTKTDSLIRKGLREEIPQTTKIVIAQRVSSIESADQIIILDDGKIADIGTHEELLKRNAAYQDLYYTQNKQARKEATL